MATLYQRTTVSPRPPARNRRRPRSLTAALAVAVWVALPVASASAAPGEVAQQPGRPDYDAAVAEVERIQQLVASAEDALEQSTVQAEATADATRIAEEALVAAEAEAAATAVVLQEAQAVTVQAEAQVATVGRQAFMGTGTLGDASILLSSEDPEDLLERASTLQVLSEDRADRLAEVEAVRRDLEEVARTAQGAVTERDAALVAAAQAQTAAVEQLAVAQQTYDAAALQRTALEEQLRAAQIALLSQQGAPEPAVTYDEQQEVVAAEASAGTAALVSGRVTSCYGNRGGTLHAGIDIAAPIGTPIYAPEDGVVLTAGPATGYGLAVTIQHPDGTVTLYGHIDSYSVSAGQAVRAGDVIAEVGNRGQSTGPHLHIETHNGGLYQNRVNPAPWLAERGISFGGRCT